MIEKTLRTIERFVPKKIYRLFQPLYHSILSLTGLIIYRHPSRRITVIGVTGTKGKSSTVSFINAVLKKAGNKTATLSTIKFTINENEVRNLHKMTMPGRFFVQKFLRDAVRAGCHYAIIEMTSEGARFYRHLGIELDVLVFTNLSPEHIESHGSFENYKNAKLKLLSRLEKSKKKNKASIANIDSHHGYSFLIRDVEHNTPYSLKEIIIQEENEHTSTFIYKNTVVTVPLPGRPMITNALAAIKVGEHYGIPLTTIIDGIASLPLLRGRLEKVDEGQPFTVIVDYAHTDDSLRKLYETFSSSRKIAVLGSTGGGRDMWKRPVLGAIADTYCDEIIITNEDPYDEDPMKIINEVASGVTLHTPTIILDRREAIQKAISLAQKGDVVLITGKGTDPYIMGPHGTKEVWDDATVAKEELHTLYPIL